VLEACFPQGAEGERVRIESSVHDREQKLSAAPISTTWTFADHAANDRQPRNRAVDRGVARLYAAIAARRGGPTAAATMPGPQLLQKTAKRRGYAGTTQSWESPVAEELNEFAQSMDSAALKRRHSPPMRCVARET
jgi:hypothetical protein